jgi:hypothetical protein
MSPRHGLPETGSVVEADVLSGSKIESLHWGNQSRVIILICLSPSKTDFCSWWSIGLYLFRSLWFIDVGLRVYWYGKHDKLPDQCRLDYNSKGVASKRSSNRIKLEQFYLPFLVLFCGYLLAFVQFCRENLKRVVRRQWTWILVRGI